MNAISVTCPHCHVTVQTAVGSTLLVAAEDDLDGSIAGTVCWICGVCNELVGVTVAARQFLALEELGGHSIGKGAAAWHPANLETRPDGSAWSYDDLLDFHWLLERPTWFDELAALCETSSGDD